MTRDVTSKAGWSRRKAAAYVALCVSAIAGLAAYCGHAPWRGASGASPATQRPVPDRQEPAAPAALVGSERCAECHPVQASAVRGSHHGKAMQVARGDTVLADFGAVTHSFGARVGTRVAGTKRLFRVEDSQGKVVDLEVRYTIGVAPLQQYLVAQDGGRLQTFEWAWDTRSLDAGGQRWFRVLEEHEVKPGDARHWTGRDQNWNSMCAACHATALRKGYQAATDSYMTELEELGVGCEACHGPASGHLAWAQRRREGKGDDRLDRGFSAPLRGASSVRFRRLPGEAIARPEGARAPSLDDRHAELARCLPCHARRQELVLAPGPAAPLLDDYAPALLEANLYHVDGQVDDEVFEVGSFVQSRMHRVGVTCSHCHDPHSAELKAQGNALCASCHSPSRYDDPGHHHHPAGSSGAACVSCHMPQKTFMGIDARRDHSLRIPRPDLSVSFGVPNPCTACHAERSATWAAEQVSGWGAKLREADTRFAAALRLGRAQAPGANAALAVVAHDARLAPIQRATALSLFAGSLADDERHALRVAASDADPWLRLGAARALLALDPDARLDVGRVLLRDAWRAIRIEAARGLADAPVGNLTSSEAAALQRGLTEYFEARRASLERPETHLELAEVYARLGQQADAELAFRRALELDSRHLEARINFADFYRATGRDAEAWTLLAETARLLPREAAVLHALGLTEVRMGRRDEALGHLREAYELGASDPIYAYAYVLALRGAGDERRADDVLARALRADPDSQLLRALHADRVGADGTPKPGDN